MEAFRVGSADPLAGGSNIMFLGVASGVIGGTAIAGGAGTIVGGLVGGIMLGVLQDGFTLQGINAFMFNIIIGAAILIAMVANIHLARGAAAVRDDEWGRSHTGRKPGQIVRPGAALAGVSMHVRAARRSASSAITAPANRR